MITTPDLQSRICPVPHTGSDRIQLGHGSGGKMSAQLLRERFLPRFGNAYLDELGDGACVTVEGGRIVMSTDTFVVSPLEFPGGNIGHLAIHGTVNDLAMMGATPKYLSAGFVLEEGLELDVLDRVRVVVVLGSFAYQQTVRILAARGVDVPSPRPRFGHGVEVALPDAGVTILCSYHPSQQNTFTGKLTEEMFDAVWGRARALLRD